MFRGSLFLFSAVVVLIAVFCLFRAGLLSGGDGKLMALIAGYLGLNDGIIAIGIGMIVGVFWSLCFHTHRRCIPVRMNMLFAYIRQLILTGKTTAYYSPEYHRDGETIPLAACLAIGTGIWLWITRLV